MDFTSPTPAPIEPPAETGSRWGWLRSLFSGHRRSVSQTIPVAQITAESSQPSQLPPSLRRLPLYLYSLRRGCLFGDCFHNGDLLQLHRLRIASASLQDALRIILPKLVVACDKSPRAIPRVMSMPVNAPPRGEATQMVQGTFRSTRSHRRVHSGKLGKPRFSSSQSAASLPYVPSMPLIPSHCYSPSLSDLPLATSEMMWSLDSPTPQVSLPSHASLQSPSVASAEELLEAESAMFRQPAFSPTSPFHSPPPHSVETNQEEEEVRSILVEKEEKDDDDELVFIDDDENENENKNAVLEGNLQSHEHHENYENENENGDLAQSKYVGFVVEEEWGIPYYIERKLVHSLQEVDISQFSVLGPESVALLSDAVVVLDTEREIFVWVGADRVNQIETDPVYSGCISLALSLTQTRNPPSIIRVVYEYTSNARYVLCNLIPSHKDPIDIVVKSIPLLQNLTSQEVRAHMGKFLHTDDLSFREYMAKLYYRKA